MNEKEYWEYVLRKVFMRTCIKIDRDRWAKISKFEFINNNSTPHLDSVRCVKLRSKENNGYF